MSKLTPDEMDRRIQELTRQAMEDDLRVRRQVARIEARDRLMKVQIEHAVNCYAQAIGSMWALALNPNLKSDAQ
jgi:hypothetical protein